MTIRSHALALCGSLLLAGPAWAQQSPPASPPAAAPPAAAGQPAMPSGGALTPAELEQLVGPIALYPDNLLANVLAASVYPDEVAEAAVFAKGARDAQVLESKNWEPAVKAIAKVPDVAKMMGEFPDWVTALGQAYLTQAQDLMAAVQTLRKKAQANGALETTQQQKVVTEGDTIYIQPSNPEVVYVPSYEPSVVYVEDDDDWDDAWVGGVIGFGAGIVVGAVWADLACDWHGGCIGWGGHGDVDIDIDRNFSGDINIGNEIGSGNRVNHRNSVGKEGGAWSPNRSKSLASSKPSQTQNFRGGGPGAAGAAPRTNMPRASSATTPRTQGAASRSAGAGSRTAGAPRSTGTSRSAGTGGTRAPSAARQPSSASRMPSSMPSTGRGQSAFSGGSGSRASSDRGSVSRQSSQRSFSSSSRSSGGSRGYSGGTRGGGGRGGGGRGGGGRR